MIKKYILFICLFLSACLGGYSPKSSFYSLQSQEAQNTYSQKLSIGVENVLLPDYLDRGQIVSFSSDGSQMYINEQERWGWQLDGMLQKTVAEDISKIFPHSIVKSKTSLLEQFTYLVKVQIVRFDKVGNNAVFTAWWQISNASGKVLYKGKTDLQETTDGSYSSYAKAQSNMIFAMCKQISAKISKK